MGYPIIAACKALFLNRTRSSGSATQLVDQNTPAQSRPLRFLSAYVELMRLPNVFTAMADVLMGFLFTHDELVQGDVGAMLLLIAASSCLYLAGMVLNDVVDLETDRLERPERPLPSGRISLAAARRLGWSLLAAGAVLASLAGLLQQSRWPAWTGLALAGAIVLYDAVLKQTPLGPLGMGACRLLNVLLGMSLVEGGWQDQHWLVAGAIGVYIAGVTWFARTEAVQSKRSHLAAATVVLLGGIGLLVWVPALAENAARLLREQPQRWYLLLALLGMLIGFRCLRAVLDPSPLRVQVAVRQCLFSLVILDAAVCFVVWGTPGAVAVLMLLIPAFVLGYWVYST